MADTVARRDAAAWVAAGLLALLLAVAFRGALAGRLFYLRDVIQNHAPVRHLVTERLRALDLPLWDPLHGGGTPLLANPNHLVMHPITPLFLLLPFDAAFTTSIVLQFVLLAAGGYLLARALPVGRPAAATAAVLLALSGPAASLASQHNVLSAFAWLPLVLWGFLGSGPGGSAARRATAVLGAAVILSTGEAASTLALVVLAPIVALARPPSPHGEPADFRGRAAVVASGLAIAALVAGLPILMARGLVLASPRAGGLPPDEAMKWSLQPARLAEMVLPRLFGDPTRLSPDAWWGGWLFEGGYPFLLSVVVGTGACLLAATALGSGPGRRLSLSLAGAFAVFVTLALGASTPVYRVLVALVPAARQVRYPERFLLGALVALALLAALGLERLDRRRAGSRAPRFFGIAAGLILVCATVMAASPALADGWLVRALRLPAGFPGSEAMAVVRGGILRSLLWAFIDALVLAAGAALLARGGRPAAWAAWCVPAAIGLSLVVATDPARSTAAPGWLHAPSPLRDLVASGPDSPRLHHAPRPPGLQVWARTDEQIWGYRFDRFTYSLMTGHPDGVPTVLDPATDRLDLAMPAAIGAGLAGLPPGDMVRLLRVAHAGWFAAWDEIDHPDLEPARVLEGLSRPALRLYRVRGLPARIRFAATAMAPAFPDDPIRSLLDPEFDPDSAVLVTSASGSPGAPGLAPASLPPGAPPSTVRVLQDDPERLRIEVAAGHPGVLVVSDSLAPGWKARLDGEPVPILRANMMFRAVEVPAGAHEVEMTYRPEGMIPGSAISAAGSILLVLYCARRRERS